MSYPAVGLDFDRSSNSMSKAMQCRSLAVCSLAKGFAKVRHPSSPYFQDASSCTKKSMRSTTRLGSTTRKLVRASKFTNLRVVLSNFSVRRSPNRLSLL